MALIFKEKFQSAMDERNIKYGEVEDNCIMIAFSGNNSDNIAIEVFFNPDGENDVALRCWSFGSVPDGKKANVLEACNKLNDEYRWVKFSIDKDNEICCAMDGLICEENAGEACLEFVQRMAQIYDESHPVLMKAFWS